MGGGGEAWGGGGGGPGGVWQKTTLFPFFFCAPFPKSQMKLFTGGGKYGDARY